MTHNFKWRLVPLAYFLLSGAYFAYSLTEGGSIHGGSDVVFLSHAFFTYVMLGVGFVLLFDGWPYMRERRVVRWYAHATLLTATSGFLLLALVFFFSQFPLRG